MRRIYQSRIRFFRCPASRAHLILLVLALAAMAMAACGHGPMGAIPAGPGEDDVPSFIGERAVPTPLPPKNVIQHPFMAESGGSHVDIYNSDVTAWPGPLGNHPEVFSRSMGLVLGDCIMRSFLPTGHVCSICYYLKSVNILDMTIVVGMDLTLFDPRTLWLLDLYEVGSLRFDIIDLLSGEIKVDLSGGYYYVDNQGRVVNAGALNAVQILELVEVGGAPMWALAESFDLRPYIPEDAGNLIAVNPDYEGNLWFMTQGGFLGYIDANTQEVFTYWFQGEVFENSMAIAPDGVYLATDYALYRFEANPEAGIAPYTWREEYERATVQKPGMLSWGTGTTPTLLGDDLVVITDNADDQVRLLVYDRLDGSPVCEVPLFEPGKSCVEISPIGYSDEEGLYNSIIVQNNYNAPDISGDYRSLVPGLTRIDVFSDRSGCEEIWTNIEVPSTTVPKLSTENGLIYTYTQLIDAPVEKAWYLAAVDFETGDTVYMVRLGTGPLKHNFYATVDIGPDGIAYQGVAAGMMAVRDGDCRTRSD